MTSFLNHAIFWGLFITVCFTVRSVICFQLNFVKGIRLCQFYFLFVYLFFAWGLLVVPLPPRPPPFLGKSILSPLNCIDSLIRGSCLLLYGPTVVPLFCLLNMLHYSFADSTPLCSMLLYNKPWPWAVCFWFYSSLFTLYWLSSGITWAWWKLPWLLLLHRNFIFLRMPSKEEIHMEEGAYNKPGCKATRLGPDSGFHNDFVRRTVIRGHIPKVLRTSWKLH